MCDFLYSIDLNVVATAISAIAAATAIAALLNDRKRFRLSQSVEMLLRFEDGFNKESFRKTRKEAARSFAKGDYEKVNDILDYFETMGLLVHRKVLDAEMVWNSFGWWILGYTKAYESYISDAIKDDRTTWSNVILLRDKIIKVDEHFTGKRGRIFTKKDVEGFLDDERSLK